MATIAQALKAQILVNLQALKDGGTIGSFMAVDTGKDALELVPADDGGFPLAVVGMPQVASDFEDTANNLRVYRFDILVMMKYAETTDPTDVEGILDKILNQFDNNSTLAGNAQAEVLPVEVNVAPISTADKTFIAFFVSIRARALYQLHT